MTILDEILEYKRREVQNKKEALPLHEFRHLVEISERSFKKALTETNLNIIAEIKFASPSAGVLSQRPNVSDWASLYEQRAQAISVLTDEKFFSGSDDYIKLAGQATTIPILRKDFIVDEYQIYESRFIGADAILLIVAALSDEELQNFMGVAKSLGLDALVETHTQQEVERALDCGADIIGINNRNLKTMKCDLSTTEKLSQLIPYDKILVSESGIKKPDDIQQLQKLVDAFLIGSSLMKVNNPKALLRKFSGIKVKICGLTNKKDVSYAIDAGADYLGFIFYKKSPRAITPEKCEKLIEHIKDKLSLSRKNSIRNNVTSVGVFVNEPIEYVEKIVKKCGLDAVQLHGEESNEYCISLKKKADVKIIKAVKIRNRILLETLQNLASDIVLLDTFSEETPGGTGKRFNWDILDILKSSKKKIFLAGGITPENVKEAVSFEQIYGIDVSSGVEMNPGKKDPVKISSLLNISKNLK